MTTETTPPPAAETLEEIAHKLTAQFYDHDRPPSRFAAYAAILSALRKRDERAVRIIDEHQVLGKCEDNCWATIKAAIREGK